MKPTRVFLLLVATGWFAGHVAGEVPVIAVKELQPFNLQVRSVADALDYLGAPLSAGEKQSLDSAMAETNAELAGAKIQSVLDAHVIFAVHINPEMRVKVAAGDVKPELVEAGWRTFLVKVHNQSGTTAELRAQSPQADRLFNSPADQVADRWLQLEMFNGQPLNKALGGLEVEYRVMQLYSRDAGRREAKVAFNVGPGTQDLGFRGEADVLFTAAPAHEVKLHVLDEDGAPTTAALTITDAQGHVFPAPAKRLAPDFFFHQQIYRADAEVLKLPEGRYGVTFERGPESIRQHRELTVSAGANDWTFQVVRWIDPSKLGWISGDHHIHAAGCAHYTKPTEGVHAADMMRHVLGEDLKVGANLTWGPCFDYQKQFFTGKDDLSRVGRGFSATTSRSAALARTIPDTCACCG